MDTFYKIFGQGMDLNILQMTMRAVVTFFIALMLVRFSGMRIFGIQSAFDICVIIMLGAVLARGVVGASPYIPTVAASAGLAIIHKLIGVLSVSNQFVSHLVKGTPHSLYKDGKLNDKNLKRCMISYGDIIEEVRISLHQNSLDNIDEIFMERTGKISLIIKH